MTKKQKRVFEIIKALKHYINTYENQIGYLDYSDEIIIKDMLYGIGIAIDEKYKWGKGFDNFKNYLATNFTQQTLCGSATLHPNQPSG